MLTCVLMPLSGSVSLKDRMRGLTVFSLEIFLQLRVITINPAALCVQEKLISMSGGAINEAGQEYETEYQKAERAAYNRLLAFIMSNLFAEPRVIRLMDLREELLQYMAGEGMTDVQASTTKHIERKLENKFGDTLHIFPFEGGQENLVLENPSIYDLARQNQVLLRNYRYSK